MNKMTITEHCPEYIHIKRDHVSYGTVLHESYFSNTTGMNRGVNILLPANYSESKKYPVLYLLHGIFGDEYTLINDADCKIVEIIGNRIADGTAKEMIVVLPNMFATSKKEQVPSFTAEGVAPYDNFINDLVNDLMPYIKEQYSVLTGRENQAIGGFSMGGREALFIGFTRSDLFGYVAGIAPAPGLTPSKDWAMTHPGQMKEEELKISDGNPTPYLVMVCCGTKDATVGQFPKSYHNIMVKNDVEHVWYEVPGADHDAQAIRSGLNHFVATIFQNDDKLQVL